MVLATTGVVKAMLFLLALCLCGALAGKVFLDHAQASQGKDSSIGGNDNFFGEEDRSEK